MSTLDKLLARSAQECERLSADQWRLALSNGHLLIVSARHDDDFLLLDAATAIKATEETLVELTEESSNFPAPVKFALRSGSPLARLRAEIPLPEESDAASLRIDSLLESMRSASHRLHNPCRVEAPEATADPEQTGALTQLLTEAGWQHHLRPGGALLTDLETGSQFLQAEIEQCGAATRCRVTRFSVTLYRDAATEAAQQTLCLYLLEANAALRYARAFFRRNEEEISAGFEVNIESPPSVSEVGHALGALSVAGRQCAREIGVLMKDGSLAGRYRSIVPLI